MNIPASSAKPNGVAEALLLAKTIEAARSARIFFMISFRWLLVRKYMSNNRA
jgi:hypothetical protein